MKSSTAGKDVDGSAQSNPEAAGSALPYATPAAFRTALKTKFAEPDAAVAVLARVADRDVGDHFRFELTKTTPLQETAKGRRVHLSAYLGSLYATFHVDIVVDTSLTGEPDTVPPLTPLLVY